MFKLKWVIKSHAVIGNQYWGKMDLQKIIYKNKGKKERYKGYSSAEQLLLQTNANALNSVHVSDSIHSIYSEAVKSQHGCCMSYLT